MERLDWKRGKRAEVRISGGYYLMSTAKRQRLKLSGSRESKDRGIDLEQLKVKLHIT